jgi:peroxiredoxin
MRRYIEETGLPFDVLIDERRDAIRAYGVWHRIGIVTWNRARPALFLIDSDATIRASWIGENQFQFPSTDEILRAIG